MDSRTRALNDIPRADEATRLLAMLKALDTALETYDPKMSERFIEGTSEIHWQLTNEQLLRDEDPVAKYMTFPGWTMDKGDSFDIGADAYDKWLSDCEVIHDASDSQGLTVDLGTFTTDA